MVTPTVDLVDDGAGITRLDQLIAAARSAVAEVATCSLSVLSDAEVRAAARAAAALRAQVDAAYLGVVRELDSRPDAVPGVRPGQAAKAFLVQAVHVESAQAARDVSAARALDADTGDLPSLGAAYAAGEVTRGHVDVAVRALARVPRHLLTMADQDGATGAQQVDRFLTDTARMLAPTDTERVAAQLLAVLDPDGADRFDPAAVSRRSASLVFDSTGMGILRAVLDPAGAATVRTALAHYSAPEPAGTAGDDDGARLTVADSRTAAQRGADALVQIARIALAQANRGGGGADDRPRIVIVATPEQVQAAQQPPPTAVPPTAVPPTAVPPAVVPPAVVPPAGLAEDEGTCRGVPPRLLGRWLCDADLQRLVLTGAGAVLDLGRTVRTVTRAQRRALAARDRGCVIPGCGAPPAWTDAHHVTWWSKGGRTDIGGLALVCGRHHSDIHAGIWSLQMIDQIPWAIPPAWIDSLRRPLRNTTQQRVAKARELGHQLRLDLEAPPPPPPPPPGDG